MHQKIQEEMFFFPGSRNRLLLGFLHAPVENKRPIGIVFCHPFADEKNLSHRVIVKTAREFASNGYYVFRFDMSGCGDSEGELNEVIISDWEEDLLAAVEILKKKSGVTQYGLLGLRLGASLALLYASKNHNASFIILWQPVLDLALYINQFFRRVSNMQIASGKSGRIPVSKMIRDLDDKGILHVIGYPISKQLFQNFTEIGKEPYDASLSQPTLILSISQSETPSAFMKEYLEFHNAPFTEIDFNHIVATTFWDHYSCTKCPEAINESLNWLKNICVEPDGRTRNLSL